MQKFCTPVLVRCIVVLCLVMIGAACQAPNTPQEQLTFESIARSLPEEQGFTIYRHEWPSIDVIATPEDLEQLVAAAGENPPRWLGQIRQFDYDEMFVLIVSGGPHPVKGSTLEVRSLTYQGEEVHVRATFHFPEDTTPIQPVDANPFHIIVVPKYPDQVLLAPELADPGITASPSPADATPATRWNKEIRFILQIDNGMARSETSHFIP